MSDYWKEPDATAPLSLITLLMALNAQCPAPVRSEAPAPAEAGVRRRVAAPTSDRPSMGRFRG